MHTDWTESEHHVDALEVEFLKAGGGAGSGREMASKTQQRHPSWAVCQLRGTSPLYRFPAGLVLHESQFKSS